MSDLEKMRRKAAKLSNPKPVELPSGSFRCRLRVGEEYISATDKDPTIAHAKVLAMKAGLIQKKEEEQRRKKGNIKLSDAIDIFIENRSNVLSPSTIWGYESIKKNRFPALMEKPVLDIDEYDLQKAVNEDAENVGHKTLKNALLLVGEVISEYKDINISKIKLPQRIKKEHKFLDEEGMINLFEAIKGSRIEIPVLLAVWLGMRRSEIMGLCWDAIDFENGSLSVVRSYVPQKGGGYILRDETKTSASRRKIECPGYILSKLEEYQADKEKRTGRVFTINPSTIYKELEKLCEENNIEFVGVHGLRHTNASVMMSLGIIDKVAMARGGWSTDVTLKQIYQHVFQSDKQSSDKKVNTFFESIAQGINPNRDTNGDTKKLKMQSFQ